MSDVDKAITQPVFMEEIILSGSTLTYLDKKNLAVLGGALIQIRSASRSGDMTAEQALERIYEIADRVHNVPSMISTGQVCDAEALLNDGVCEHWPTGLTAATSENLAAFILFDRRAEFEKA